MDIIPNKELLLSRINKNVSKIVLLLFITLIIFYLLTGSFILFPTALFICFGYWTYTKKKDFGKEPLVFTLKIIVLLFLIEQAGKSIIKAIPDPVLSLLIIIFIGVVVVIPTWLCVLNYWLKQEKISNTYLAIVIFLVLQGILRSLIATGVILFSWLSI